MAVAGNSAKSALSQVGKAAQIKSYQKYTVQPTGFWARVNSFFAVDSKRSTGIPLNPQFRNPIQAEPSLYSEALVVPSGDIAENPYWKRDTRRQYPQLSVVTQANVVALLTVGSAAAPKDDVLQIGDAGAKQLVAVREEGEKGLSAFFEKDKSAFKGVLAANGMPPLPPSRSSRGDRYEMLEEQTYEDTVKYTCRTFV